MPNNTHHPFDPSLKAFFSGAACRAAEPYRQGSRELFYTLMHLSEHDAVYPAAYDFIKQQLAEVRLLEQALQSHSENEDKLKDELTALASQLGSLQFTDKSLQNCLLQLSPVILTEPCWLQSISQAATSQNSLAVDLMAVYLDFSRGETDGDLFHALLLTIGLELPSLTSRMFAQQEAIGACLFDFAATQLALACFPRVFFPEILGFTMAYCESPSFLQSVHTIDGDQCLTRYVNFNHRLKNTALPAVSHVIDDYLKVFSDQADEIRHRIQSGYRLYRSHAERCYRHLFQQLQKPPTASDRWIRLLKSKAPSAVGHHRKIKLAGRSLDDWFAESPFDSAGFLSALNQSPYIDRTHPENSPLLKLFDFNGPMFGVLNGDEREILESWLNAEPDEVPADTPGIEEGATRSWRSDEVSNPAIQYSSLNNRELYYYLVNADLYPEVLTAARHNVHTVLRSARRFNRIPFIPYSHQAFENFIDAIYQREVNTYQPVSSKPKLSKEAYVWGIEQLAPAILTDGCWLQTVDQLKHYPNRDIGALLFKIYVDEIGNGKLEQNHPFIYQQLLSSVDLNLPPIFSRKFIEYPGFIDSTFDLPVYLLSISKFPSAFLPELLGLNLAIELSGLGNIYLRLSEELNYWGINSAIVDVHISIDNVSSGHAYLAKNAIQLYLDAIAAGFGDDVVQTHWRRIFNGYCSLQSVNREFKLALVCRYLFNRMTKRLSIH